MGWLVAAIVNEGLRIGLLQLRLIGGRVGVQVKDFLIIDGVVQTVVRFRRVWGIVVGSSCSRSGDWRQTWPGQFERADCLSVLRLSTRGNFALSRGKRVQLKVLQSGLRQLLKAAFVKVQLIVQGSHMGVVHGWPWCFTVTDGKNLVHPAAASRPTSPRSLYRDTLSNMTKPKKDVKFQHKEARRPSRSSNDSQDASDLSSPTRNEKLSKPEVSRNMSYDGAWTDDDKASSSRSATKSPKLTHLLKPQEPHIILVDKVLLPFATHHRFISFMLYVMGFVFFVVSLEKGHYKFQFQQFAWTHMALYLIVVQAHFIMNNIFEGMIWFFLPAALVITNDIFAYICGITFGRTQLIKISPKKTVEGFVGAWVFTIIFAFGLSNILMRSKYFICPVNNLGANIFTGLECDVNPVFLSHTYQLPFIPPNWSHLPTTITVAPVQFHIMIFATFASLIAPFGGFFASGLKRTFNIKDFGDSIPGHGGMTDRMDCQFIMGFFAYMYYQSFIAVYKASVGSVIETAITGLTPEQQMEVVKGLSKHLVNQGIINPRVLEYLGEQLRR
ncbi:phosphatidate cytidylyltransferase [Aureobasidium pullulans]|nr:phosphatidate cytidylyltransferase [Aureobasidium pullulans]